MRGIRVWLMFCLVPLVLAAPAKAVVVFEWHQVTSITDGPATNAALTSLPFGPVGTVSFLQLMIRDTTGTSFPWSFGDGLIPPPPSENINGTGFFGLGAAVRGTNNLFEVGGNTLADRRLVTIPDTEVPLAFQGQVPPVQPYSAPIWTPQPTVSGMDFQVISNLADGNPYESGDFPRNRGGAGGFLMPLFNIRFVRTGGFGATLTIVDARPGATNEDNQIGTTNGATLATLDTLLFSTAPVLTDVPEPSSFVLAGMAVVGLWKVRRRKLK